MYVNIIFYYNIYVHIMKKIRDLKQLYVAMNNNEVVCFGTNLNPLFLNFS